VTQEATDAQVQEWLEDDLHAYPDADMRPSREAVLADWIQRFGRGGRLLHHSSPGCEHCDRTGHRGRLGLHELLLVSREVRRLIQTGGRVEQH
jgi:type II secretory ATPase GspE/PulE/Tfp pilus assembly ATPase PilB-like protein